MKIVDIIEKTDAYGLYSLIKEMEENFNPRIGKFNSCIDELEWFRVRGIKNRLHDCSGECIHCELEFLNQEVEF